MTWATLNGEAPRIIAHRGASGLMPEHTQEAWELALAQGADVVEPDLVMSADGQLIVRHGRELSRTTDIASRPEFAARRRGDGWWVEDFTLAELSRLRAVQPFPSRSRQFDGQFLIPSFAGMLLWAEAVSRRLDYPITLYPELKQPAFFSARGLDSVRRFLSQARQRNPLRVRLWLQCFELEPLLALREAAEVPVFLLLPQNAPWRRLIAQHAGQVDGFGVHKGSLLNVDGSSSELVEMAHAHGCEVHAYTYRDDVPQSGFERVEEELDVAFALGVDALFCDFPKTALLHRKRFAEQSDKYIGR